MRIFERCLVAMVFVGLTGCGKQATETSNSKKSEEEPAKIEARAEPEVGIKAPATAQPEVPKVRSQVEATLKEATSQVKTVAKALHRTRSPLR